MDYGMYIESDPVVMLGKPVIKGTHIPVEFASQKLSEGATVEQLVAAYPSLKHEYIWALLKTVRNFKCQLFFFIF